MENAQRGLHFIPSAGEEKSQQSRVPSSRHKHTEKRMERKKKREEKFTRLLRQNKRFTLLAASFSVKEKQGAKIFSFPREKHTRTFLPSVKINNKIFTIVLVGGKSHSLCGARVFSFPITQERATRLCHVLISHFSIFGHIQGDEERGKLF